MTPTHFFSESEEKAVLEINRRAAVRYQCAPATAGKLLLSGDHEYQKAWVVDLSQGGVGLRLVRPLPVGTFLVLLIKSSDGKKTYELAAEVAHATSQNNEWTVGCKLLQPLTQDDLDALL